MSYIAGRVTTTGSARRHGKRIGKLNRGARQAFFNINLPATDFDKAAGIGQPLTIPLSESPLYVGRLCLLASGLAQDRQRRVLTVVAAMMRPMRQSIMVTDQFAMKFNRFLNCFTPLPVIL